MADAPRIRCPSETDTIALGERIGSRLEPGDLLSLSGPLGAGKTVLVRGIAVGVGADPAAVRSPTFVLHHVYPAGRMRLHHIDLYRLGAGADVTFLDLEALLEGGAVVVEWGELASLRTFSPARLTIDIESDGTRVIELESPAPDRIAAAWGVEVGRG
jgi:tRNA threonylcarbamoyladenosine biosynthesis protein TsaE